MWVRIEPKLVALLETTKKALMAGIKAAKEASIPLILLPRSNASVRLPVMAIVEELVGHGVGYGVHEDP